MEWLHEGHFARGMLTLVVGDGGVGKSLFIYDTATRISKGLTWPEGQAAAPFEASILFDAEDHLDVALQPRVAAHGADLDRIYTVRAIYDGQSERPFDLTKDLAQLEKDIIETGAIFVSINPINSYFGNKDS